MRLEKYSLYSDSVANLYRAAFYLARGSVKVSFEFLKRAQEKLGKNKSFELGKILVKVNKKKVLIGQKKY